MGPCMCGCDNNCNPATTKICIQPTSKCGGAAVNGASVTVKDSHGTTVGTCTVASGSCCVGISKKDTYTITVTATGYCDYTTTLAITSCGTTHNVSAVMYPTTIPLTITALIECGVDPSGSYPVAVTITQAAGGSFSTTCTITSSAGCTVNVPAPCPGSGTNFTYSIVPTNSCFQPTAGTTYSVTLPASGPSWLCSAAVAVNLPCAQDGHFGNISLGCCDAIPASVTVTIFITRPLVGPDPCNGTYTLPYVGRGAGCRGAAFATTITCSDGSHATLSVHIDHQTGGCPGSNYVELDYSGGGGIVTWGASSGTTECPISFSGTATGQPTWTATVS